MPFPRLELVDAGSTLLKYVISKLLISHHTLFLKTFFSKPIYRRACKLGLQAAYKSGGFAKIIVKKLIAIALLPSGEAYEGFQVCNIVFVSSFLLPEN